MSAVEQLDAAGEVLGPAVRAVIVRIGESTVRNWLRRERETGRGAPSRAGWAAGRPRQAGG